jgi:hypothetical protein
MRVRYRYDDVKERGNDVMRVSYGFKVNGMCKDVML